MSMTIAVSLKQRLFVWWVVLTFVLAAIPPAQAVSNGLKALPGHVPKAVTKLPIKGTLASTNRLNLAIGLPLRDQRGLSNFLAQIYDPAGPNFRHYLTPEEFTERFGPTEADYAAVVQFAQTNGLTVTATHGNRLLLDVNGPVANIQRAFHLTLHTYQHPTEARDFYAPDAEPSVDATLPIADVSGLNNFARPHPRVVRGGATNPSAALPKTGSAPDGTFMGNDFRAAYLPDVTLRGSGQIVGLFQFDGFYPSDIAAYETANGLPDVPIKTVLLDGFDGTPTTGSGSGNIEVSLDIEMTLSMAPGLSQILVFEAGPDGFQNDILNTMAASNQVKQFSCSWGWSGGPNTTTDAIFQQMAVQGQSFFCASGDSDAYTIGADSANGVDNPTLSNAPDSSPYVTLVGGTTLTTTGAGGSWTSETAWNWGFHNGSYVGTSGGVSSYYSIPIWQSTVDMSANAGSTAFRNIPDVALVANSVHVLYGNGASESAGGTSCAAPLWAGLTALINQQVAAAGKASVGLVNSAVYAIGQGSLYASTFHDITTGNNVSSDSPSNYHAVSGYDLCTGWGTPAGQALIDALAAQADSLVITPGSGFAASGPVGGPFPATSQTAVLTNTGSSSLQWSLINTSAWLSASSTAGTLTAGASTPIDISLDASATNLFAGAYSAIVLFTNWTSHAVRGLLFTLQVSGQDLVQNGGFETGDFTSWTLVGNTIVNNRHGPTIYNAVENTSSYPLTVHSGNYGAFMGDNQLATLSQTLATVPGQTYLLSLWLDNPTTGGTQEFEVNWNTNSPAVNTLSSLISPPVLTWTNLLFLVTATGPSTVLQFAAENDNNYFGLDDISVIPMPTVAFQSAELTSSGFTLTWSATAGLAYQVQYKTNLAQADWLALGPSLFATNRVLTVSDPDATPVSEPRFYRLIVTP